MNDMKQLERLISASVSPYHCIMTAAASLDGAGFTELSLSGSWKLEQGHSYYIKAYDSTLIAFTIGELADQTPKLKLAASRTENSTQRSTADRFFTPGLTDRCPWQAKSA